MKITKYGFPGILKDNDKFYIGFVTDAMKHSDPDAEVLINKFDTDIKVSITPSEPEFRQHIIQNLLDAHRLFKIKIIFSKSLAKEKRVNFLVEM